MDYESMERYKEINDILSERNDYNNNMNKSTKSKSHYYDDDNKDIRTSKYLNKKCADERNYLVGFIKPKKIERQFRKHFPKIKSSINIYKKEWELEKIVNPIKYKIEEEKELKELQIMKEKIDKEREFITFRIKNLKKKKILP